MSQSHPSPDVIIVGGGPAGLSAALTLGRAGRTVTVVDNEQPRNRFADHMQSFLTRDGTPPSDFIAIARAEVQGYGVVLYEGTAIGARWDDATCTVTVMLADESTITGRRLLVTTGLTDLLPKIPGLAERWGKEVIHCPFCHGHEVRDRQIGILATGENSLHQAFLFRQWTDDLLVFAHTETIDPATRNRLASRNVQVIDGIVRRLILDPVLQGVELEDGRVIGRQVLVVAPRFSANASIPVAMGASTEEASYGSWVVVDRAGKTAVPGVYAAGNVTDPMAQVMSAASSGAMTAGAIVMDLITEDFNRAEAALLAASSTSA